MNDPKNWWNKNLEHKIDAFKSWIGDHTAETKQTAAAYISKKKYKTVLDIACGTASFKKALELAGSKARYTGVDSANYWKLKGHDFTLVQNDAEDLKDILDKSFDVVFMRHILEHLPTFQRGLSEALRVAKKEVIVVFFNKPADKEEIRTVFDDGVVYTNIYSTKDIEKFLEDYTYRWEDVNLQEIILYIKL